MKSLGTINGITEMETTFPLTILTTCVRCDHYWILHHNRNPKNPLGCPKHERTREVNLFEN
jgi:hypothetical protein